MGKSAKQVSKRKMGIFLHAFHIFMLFPTCGLWGFVYWNGLRKRKTVTYIDG